MESLTLYRNGEYLASSAKRFDSNGVLEHQDSRSGGISRGRSCRSINAAAQTSATFVQSARPTQLSDIASQAFLDHLLGRSASVPWISTTLAVWSGTGLNEAADAAVERSLEARAPGGARGVGGVARCRSPVRPDARRNHSGGSPYSED